MPIEEGTRSEKTAKFFYDFAVDGGAISTINLRGEDTIPPNSVITSGYIDVLTQLTSGGAATIALQAEAAGDIVAATAVATWTAGRKNTLIAPASGSVTAATIVKTTVARNPAVVIAAAALTAGKFELVLRYI
jgi:hypothetical protein